MAEDVARVNAELRKLDELVHDGKMSREDYRNRRRQLITDLESEGSETIPARGPDDTVEHQPTPTVARAATAGSGVRFTSILVGVGVFAALVLAAVFVPRGRQAPAAGAPVAAAVASPATAGADLPQAVAARLMKTEWTPADIDDFLGRWSQVSAEARKAAGDDAGLWLLRGETDRRLREASDAQAIDPTPETKARIDQLSRLQSAIRTD